MNFYEKSFSNWPADKVYSILGENTVCNFERTTELMKVCIRSKKRTHEFLFLQRKEIGRGNIFISQKSDAI